MAEQEHVERLTRSVPDWNLWRQQRPEILPDLSSADLSRTNLKKANLSRANLNEANLSHTVLNEVNLSGATLTFAILISANCTRANFCNADLSFSILNHSNLTFANLYNSVHHQASLCHTILYGANFSNASLAGADLSNAYLGFAKLSRANLSDVNFTGVHLLCTSFIKVDLSSIQGLDTARHRGPSTVDVSSVILPHDEQTRLHFLCGVGFTRTEIDSLLSLPPPQFIDAPALFISSTHQDKAIAKRLSADLREHNVPCWFTDHDAYPSQPILGDIEKVIHAQDTFLLVLSKHAISSSWIEQEVDAVLHQEIKYGKPVLLPIRLDNAVLQSHVDWVTRLQHRHIADFTGWQDDTAYHRAFTTLLRYLLRDTQLVRYRK
jgi:hypothetical protein